MSSKVRIVMSWISTVGHESKLRITENMSSQERIIEVMSKKVL
jgi:hypothetical protein